MTERAQHTNCWCPPNIVECSKPDCPRWARRAKDREEARAFHNMIRELRANPKEGDK
jgi:hypothetical protein